MESSWPGTFRATSAGWPKRARPNTRCPCSATRRCTEWAGDPTPTERGPPVGPGDGRVESRGGRKSICSRPTCTARRTSAVRALYAFGRHDAMGFSPFGIDRPDRLGNTPDLTGAYDLLSRLAPLILQHQGNGTMSAVLLNPKDPPRKIQLGDYTLEGAF